MRRHLRSIVVTLVIVAIAVAIFFKVTQEKPVSVTLAKVEQGTVESLVSNTRAGTVKACRRARLSPAIGGQIAHLMVKEGDHVEAGQVLLELWNEDLVAQVQLAESEAKAVTASAEQACLNAQVARREANRLVELQKKHLASEEQVDRAVTNAKASEAGCRAAKAQAQVSTSRVAVAKAALERTILKAPFTGSVAEVNGELGEYVTPSPPGIPTPPVVDIVDTSCLYILAPIDEVDAPEIKPGMRARITLDAFAGKSFQGVVRRVAPYVLEVEKQARTVDVEAEFINPSEYKDLLPGYSADVEVIIATHKDVTRIPTEALLEGNRVLVYRPSDGLLEERKITIGLSNWQYTQVTSGLSVGEYVVTSVGREGVKAGAYGKPEQPLNERS